MDYANTPSGTVPPPPAGPPPGWYTDPNYGYGLRWWDGERWTAHYQGPPAPMPQQQQQASDGLVAAGIIFALLMPLVGFIIGIVLMAKNRAGAGVTSVVLSVVAFFAWSAVLVEQGYY